MGRYFRLMALAATEICLSTPLSLFSMIVNLQVGPLNKWVSWEDTHFNYSRVQQIPAFFWKKNHNTVLGMEFTRWVPVLCALIFFIFFGFADEAKKNYRRAFWFIAGRLGIERPTPTLPKSAPTIGSVHLLLTFYSSLISVFLLQTIRKA